MTDYDRARKMMVDNQLRTAGITDRRLLAAMGYGQSGTLEPTGRSGDGGIDGIISQDPLGNR